MFNQNVVRILPNQGDGRGPGFTGIARPSIWSKIELSEPAINGSIALFENKLRRHRPRPNRRPIRNRLFETPPMILGYNTNGFSHHSCFDAVKVIAEIGYRSVAITVDHHCLNPFDPQYSVQLRELRKLLGDEQLSCVIETGGRFLLDTKIKHEPTLMSADASRRIDFYRHCIDCAVELGSPCVSLWSGILRDDLADEAALERLSDGLAEVLRFAEAAGVLIGFEPEPGMYIDTTSRFERLRQWVDSPNLKMTMDVGHLYCLHEVPIADYLHRFAKQIVNVHIEDMKAGVHEHLMFGEGDMNFPPIIDALRSAGYANGIHVELSRHSHDAPAYAQRAFDFLSPLLNP